jgi:hypothetical protein
MRWTPGLRRSRDAGLQSSDTPEIERALKGQRQEGTGRVGFSDLCGTNSPGRSKLCSRARAQVLSGTFARGNGKRARGPERGTAPRRGTEALKTKPHERYRDETSPDGVAGCKPSRACETLRTDGGGWWVTRVLVRSVRRAIRKGRSRATNEPVRRKVHSYRTRGPSCAVGGRSPGGRSPARLLVAAATRRRNTNAGTAPPVVP